MAKQFFNAAGQRVTLPETLEQARKYRRSHYAGSEVCPVCEARGDVGMITRKRYTATGGCVHCATLDALELYSLALDLKLGIYPRLYFDREVWVFVNWRGIERAVSETYFNKLRHATRDLFPDETRHIPTTPAGAAEKGLSLYIREKPCRKAGHLGVTQVTGECYYCTTEKGTSLHDARETPDSLMMREAPDLIVSRKDAKALGFKVYRTGEACRKGHKGFRYISTGNCLSCRG